MNDYNKRLRDITAQCRPAVNAAKHARSARLAAAQADRDRAVGSAKASFDADTEAAVQQFKAQRAAAWEQFVEQHHGQAQASFKYSCELAEEIYADELAKATAPIEAFKAEYARERRANSKAGREFAEHKAQADAQSEAAYHRAVAEGWPDTFWARWAHVVDRYEGTDWHYWEQLAPWRERWLVDHPEHRDMLESPNPDLWDAAMAQRTGMTVTRMDRHRWPA